VDVSRDSHAPDTLVEQMQARIDSLEHRVDQANERDGENRRIIAALNARIPEIEAPADTASEAPQTPTEATEQPGRVEPQPAVESSQEPAEPRSWWRRMFGG
jgi:hypothetical protein